MAQERWRMSGGFREATKWFVGLIFFFVFASAPHASPVKFVTTTADSSTVIFHSPAKMEFIEGKSSSLNGEVIVDPAQISAGAQGWFVCDLKTLRTGIEMRDGHMRDRYLEVKKYPSARFDLTKVTRLPDNIAAKDSAYPATFYGKFTIHGTTREMSATGTVRYHPVPSGNPRLDINANFAIKLDDYGIERPKAVFLKLAETIEISIATQISAAAAVTTTGGK